MNSVLPALLGVVAGALLSIAPSYWAGIQKGVEREKNAALARAISVQAERGAIDAEIISSDADSMCRFIIGLRGKELDECLRGLVKANP